MTTDEIAELVFKRRVQMTVYLNDTDPRAWTCSMMTRGARSGVVSISNDGPTIKSAMEKAWATLCCAKGWPMTTAEPNPEFVETTDAPRNEDWIPF